MFNLAIIPNEVLRNITVKDNNEQLVDLREKCPHLLFKIPDYIKLNGGDKAFQDAHYAREGLATRLNKAHTLLPSGYKLLIDTAYRSPATQQKSYYAVFQDLKEEYPTWTQVQLEAEMDKRVSPVDIAPHCTGGAVDLTIIDSNNKELNMGTEIDEYTDHTYTDSPQISTEAKQNRTILKNVMNSVGFINFPAEWWHWSYGDREWSFYQKDKVSIYAAIKR